MKKSCDSKKLINKRSNMNIIANHYPSRKKEMSNVSEKRINSYAKSKKK